MWPTHNSRRPRRCRPSVERLEDRLVLSADGRPDIAGAALTPEAGLYTLTLDAAGKSVESWFIDWGDGDTETLPGSATSTDHTYGDGPVARTITVTSTETSPLLQFQWTAASGGNDHWYALSATARNWLNAEAEAVALGGHLVSITSQAEQNFLVANFPMVKGDPTTIYWIGVNDRVTEGQYVWSSGEAVGFKAWQLPNEPNNFNGVEDYGTINWHWGNNRSTATAPGTWNDAPLNGLNGLSPTLTGNQLYRGLMEFTSEQFGPVTVRTLGVTVENVAPTVSLAGPSSGLRGQEQTFTLGVGDPSAADVAAGFTYAIDWDGDGVTDETVVGGDGKQVSHTFAASGVYQVGMTVMDRDGGVSAAETLEVTITTLTLENGVLTIGGTPGDDVISIRGWPHGSVQVGIDGAEEGAFTEVTEIKVFGYDGNDTIAVLVCALPAELHGGDGDDTLSSSLGEGLLFGEGGNDLLIGGVKRDVLVGGEGDDVLFGLGLADVLIGGGGSDRFLGAGAGDLIVSGATAHDTDTTALKALRSEWAAIGSRASKMAKLRGGLLQASSVLADHVVDRIFAFHRDSILAGAEDRVNS